MQLQALSNYVIVCACVCPCVCVCQCVCALARGCVRSNYADMAYILCSFRWPWPWCHRMRKFSADPASTLLLGQRLGVLSGEVFRKLNKKYEDVTCCNGRPWKLVLLQCVNAVCVCVYRVYVTVCMCVCVPVCVCAVCVCARARTCERVRERLGGRGGGETMHEKTNEKNKQRSAHFKHKPICSYHSKNVGLQARSDQKQKKV